MKEQIIEELEFEIMVAEKTGHQDLVPGLERALKIIGDM
jgi:hypothetical protein